MRETEQKKKNQRIKRDIELENTMNYIEEDNTDGIFIYIAVSNEDLKSCSLDYQIWDLFNYIQDAPFEFIKGVFCDIGDYTNYSGFKAMLDDLEFLDGYHKILVLYPEVLDCVPSKLLNELEKFDNFKIEYIESHSNFKIINKLIDKLIEEYGGLSK